MAGRIKQWQFNRALQASKLKAPTRAVLMNLGVLADWPGGIIPAQFSPSLNKIATITGFTRRTVMDHLNIAEEEGWVIRRRPETSDALANNERTAYELTIPDKSLIPAETAQQEPNPEQENETEGVGQELPWGQGGRAGAALGVGQEMPGGRAGNARGVGQELPSTISSPVLPISSSSTGARRGSPAAQIAAHFNCEEEEAEKFFQNLIKNRGEGQRIAAPSRWVASVLASGDAEKLWDDWRKQTVKPAYAGPRCDLVLDRDGQTCETCSLPAMHPRHRVAA
jgi:hypothetical protein